MNDMRKLLSSAIPDPEDEPRQRDVVDAAMAWGQRRRRQDWMLGGVAALAVVAVGAGVAVLGTGSGSGTTTTAASGGGDPLKSPGSPFDPAVADGKPFPSISPTCTPWGNVPPSQREKYCELWKEQVAWASDFAKGSVPYIKKTLPAGFTVKASDSYVVELTAPNGKTNILFPSATSVSTLDGRTPGCPPQGGDSCTETSIGGGKAVVGKYPSAGQSAEWIADGLKDPRILMGVNTAGTPGIGGLPAPTGTALLSGADIARIIGNPEFVQYAKQQWQREVDIITQMQKIQGPSSTDSATGSAPGSPSGSATESPSGGTPGSPSGSATWWPSGGITPSGSGTTSTSSGSTGASHS